MLQTLFICSGCDYISFFVGLGKTAMHTHSQDIPGTLADTGHDQMEEEFLSFATDWHSVLLKSPSRVHSRYTSCIVHVTHTGRYWSCTATGGSLR